MIGISLRLALALGLHLRNEDPSTPASKKETLVRTWWSLHSIECVLSAVTGRPCIIGHEDCTVSLPHIFSKVYSNVGNASGGTPARSDYRASTAQSSSIGGSSPGRMTAAPLSYLDAHINIGLITQKVLAKLYSPRTSTQSWEYIQKAIPELMKELDEWRRSALLDDAPGPKNPFASHEGRREYTLLSFSYYSTKILITRPCLCRTERRIKRQSEGSANFNQKTAEACVQAAQGLTSLLPDQPDLQSLYENAPWWCIIHNSK